MMLILTMTVYFALEKVGRGRKKKKLGGGGSLHIMSALIYLTLCLYIWDGLYMYEYMLFPVILDE